jgi:SAM-dependent methyltransferase
VVSEIHEIARLKMQPFDRIATHYDVLYREKNYAQECATVNRLVQRYERAPVPEERALIDFGCGTGRHAALFAAVYGFSVLGVERSAPMIERAHFSPIVEGDIRSAEVYRGAHRLTFDVAVALFDVVSYLTSDEDLVSFFETVHRHLNPHGLLIFDCWHTPAVLAQKPQTRVREAEGVVRIARPTIEGNVVHVAYDLFTHNFRGSYDRSREQHSLRHFNGSELASLYVKRFKHLDSLGWDGSAPSSQTWSALHVLRAI